MRSQSSKWFLASAVICALGASAGLAQVTVQVEPSTEDWKGWMNVAELDGTPLWGSPWGIPDLSATFDDPNNELTLGAAPMGDPHAYWYQGGDPNDPNSFPGGPGVPGNKLMEANLFREFIGGAMPGGQLMTFEGEVLANTFTAEHEAYLFIKDFPGDWSSPVETKIPLVPGPFSFSANLVDEPGRHVQYGFQVIGPNVWPDDVGLFGNAVIATIPEPASMLLVLAAGLIVRRR